MEKCEVDLKMETRVVKFTIPFFAILNAAASSLYIVMSCVFLANYDNFTLTTANYIIIVLMSSILCFCLPTVPSSSIVTLLIVMSAVNFENSNIAILYTVEWLLDRFLI
jgi:Na+/H+-dicarboxylate symporter